MIAQVGLASEMIVAGSRPNLPLVVLCLALFWLRDAQVFFWAILVGIICETFDDAHPGTGVLVVTALCWFVYRIQVALRTAITCESCVSLHHHGTGL